MGFLFSFFSQKKRSHNNWSMKIFLGFILLTVYVKEELFFITLSNSILYYINSFYPLIPQGFGAFTGACWNSIITLCKPRNVLLGSYSIMQHKLFPIRCLTSRIQPDNLTERSQKKRKQDFTVVTASTIFMSGE